MSVEPLSFHPEKHGPYAARRARRLFLALIWTLIVMLAVVGPIGSDRATLTTTAMVVVAVALVGIGSLGVLMVIRTGNLIGWLLAGGGMVFGYQYWAWTREPGLTEDWLVNSVGYVASLLVVPVIVLLFPDGKPPSPRWRSVLWLGLGAFATGVLSTLLAPTVWGSDLPAPLAGVLPDSALAALDISSTLMLLVFLAAVVAAPIVRYHRAGPLQRLQFKMVGFGAAIALAGQIAFSDSGLQGVDPLIPGAISLMALPVSITAAIMRYHLYDIERLISRTVGYAIVIAILAALYVFGAVWVPSRIIGTQSPVFVAGSTLIVAAIFNPIRRRVIRATDQRFYRSRYDAGLVLDRFGDRLKNQIDMHQIADESIAVISQTMQPSSAGVWIRG